MEDSTTFASLIVGSFDQQIRPKTIVSPQGTHRTIFTAPQQSSRARGAADATTEPPDTQTEADKQPNDDAAAPAQQTTPTQQTPPINASGPSARPIPTCHHVLNLNRSFLIVPSRTHLSVLRSLGIRSSVSISITVGSELYGVLAFYSAMQTHLRMKERQVTDPTVTPRM